MSSPNPVSKLDQPHNWTNKECRRRLRQPPLRDTLHCGAHAADGASDVLSDQAAGPTVTANN